MYISNKRNRTLWRDLGFTGEPGIQVNQGKYRRTRDIQENQSYTRKPGIYKRIRDIKENQGYTG